MRFLLPLFVGLIFTALGAFLNLALLLAMPASVAGAMSDLAFQGLVIVQLSTTLCLGLVSALAFADA